MIKVLTAWNFRARERRAELVRTMPSAAENLKEEAVQSEAIVTGDEVLGVDCCKGSAWNFRANERRAELVRAMPSAAENLKEEAVRQWRGKSYGVVPSRHIVLTMFSEDFVPGYCRYAP